MKELPQQAQRHSRVRDQHSTELAQDYVEAIAEFSQSGNIVRVKDLQQKFGVSHVSVIRALQRLEAQSYVTRTRSEGVSLTIEGKYLAQKSAERHSLFVDVLCALGVDPQQAEEDAEGAEHHLSEQTLAAMRRFLDGRSKG